MSGMNLIVDSVATPSSVIDSRIAGRPSFWLLIVLVQLPKLFDELEYVLWSAYFGVTKFGVVLHSLGLPEAHGHAVLFIVQASLAFSLFFFFVVFDTSIDQVFIKLLLVAQWIVGRNVRMMHGEGDIDAILEGAFGRGSVHIYVRCVSSCRGTQL